MTELSSQNYPHLFRLNSKEFFELSPHIFFHLDPKISLHFDPFGLSPCDLTWFFVDDHGHDVGLVQPGSGNIFDVVEHHPLGPQLT